MEQAVRSSAKSTSLAASLNQRLNTYVVAATAAGVSALAMAQGAEAQIVFTPANKTINTGEKLLIDLNHDGVADVVIREAKCSRSVYFPGNSLQAVPPIGRRCRANLSWGSGCTVGGFGDWRSQVSQFPHRRYGNLHELRSLLLRIMGGL